MIGAAKGAVGTLVWGVLGAAVAVGAFLYFRAAGWHVYDAWLIGSGIATFGLWALDKTMRKRKRGGVPTTLLHGMALLGGFGGGFLAMVGLWHRITRISTWLVLIVALLLHRGLARFLFS